ncbi:hypothetical protein Tco_0727518 [Tanacetum coccineum]|uniref:Uncharacterized protein n=1 Tax=Tanacetum coccineum TaxID=301880 RepID=A0ABQ4YL49_9ASTR
MLTTRQGATIVDIEQLIAQRVADAMATLEANWNNGNGIPHEEVSEELCTPPVCIDMLEHSYKDGCKYTAYEMSWKELMKMITEVYCPRNEINKMGERLLKLTVEESDVLG